MGPGFLELVRLGLRRSDDPHIQDSVRGRGWHRYTYDGYGEDTQR
jgi:hypothetical protein